MVGHEILVPQIFLDLYETVLESLYRDKCEFLWYPHFSQNPAEQLQALGEDTTVKVFFESKIFWNIYLKSQYCFGCSWNFIPENISGLKQYLNLSTKDNCEIMWYHISCVMRQRTKLQTLKDDIYNCLKKIILKQDFNEKMKTKCY